MLKIVAVQASKAVVVQAFRAASEEIVGSRADLQVCPTKKYACNQSGMFQGPVRCYGYARSALVEIYRALGGGMAAVIAACGTP